MCVSLLLSPSLADWSYEWCTGWEWDTLGFLTGAASKKLVPHTDACTHRLALISAKIGLTLFKELIFVPNLLFVLSSDSVAHAFFIASDLNLSYEYLSSANLSLD